MSRLAALADPPVALPRDVPSIPEDLPFPNAATLESYGEWVFSPYTLTRVSSSPVYDRAGRTVKYQTVTLDVTTYVMAPFLDFEVAHDTEIKMDDVWKQLGRRGDCLRLVGLGLGHIVVNDPDPDPEQFPLVHYYRDVAMGPHPKVVQAIPCGSNKAWIVRWTLTTNIVHCAEGTAKDDGGRIMAFTYTWDVSQDEQGFATRTISGELEIPATLLVRDNMPQRLMDEVADKYWEMVLASIPVPGSFQRRWAKTLSEDRRTLSFTITDKQLGARSFIPGATMWRGEQSVRSNLQDGFTRWTNTLAATYWTAQNVAKREMYAHFMSLVRSRTGPRGVKGGQVDPATGRKKLSFFPLEMEVRDDLPAQEVTFMFRWFYVTTWAEALRGSGVWRDIPAADWDAWAASMGASSLHPRGLSRLVYDPKSDSIVDLCDNPVLHHLTTPGAFPGGTIPPGGDGAPGTAGTGGNIEANKPDQESSWVGYEASIEYFSQHGNVLLRALPKETPGTRGGPGLVDPATLKPAGGVKAGGGGPGDKIVVPVDPPLPQLFSDAPPTSQPVQVTIPIVESPSVQNIVQERVLPLSFARLRGRALRVGYDVSPPQLVACCGSPAHLHEIYLYDRYVANYGLPVVYAEWDLLYYLPNPTNQTMPKPNNPVLGL